MMHGPEKSDPGIVAMKPANKTEQSVAEPVERRAGTKGNADQQSTCRTQSRISVSQALERIRKVQNACRQTPEVGAVCGKAARTVLCGGRSAMSVPTASEIYLLRCVSLLLAHYNRPPFLSRASLTEHCGHGWTRHPRAVRPKRGDCLRIDVPVPGSRSSRRSWHSGSPCLFVCDVR